MPHNYLPAHDESRDVRLVQVLIPDGKRQVVEETLAEHEIAYSLLDETSDRGSDGLAQFLIPTVAVESVLDDLDAVGIGENTQIVVLDIETAISAEFEELAETYEDEEVAEEEPGGVTGGERIARQELQARANELVTATPTYVVLTLVSAVIATAGMLLDSPATIVGSMVIAPLIGPSMAASVGTVVNDRELFADGVKLQLLGIFVAVASATVFALAVRYLYLVPPGLEVLDLSEVNERATPNFLVLAIALGAGIAGILSLMTGVSTALVGVMIAVALIPPAAAVGLGLAFAIPRLAIGAGVLVTVNVLSINLASLVALWVEGYRPERWFHVGAARGALVRQVGVLILTIALMSVFLGGATYDSYVAATDEEEVRAAVAEELAEADAQLELREIALTRSGVVPPLETERVVVRIAIEPGAEPPGLSDRLAARIEEVLGKNVAVEIEYVLVEWPDREAPPEG